jgi:hypothetical protein
MMEAPVTVFAELLLILLMGAALPADLEPLPVDRLLNGMPAECEVLLVQDVRGTWEAVTGFVEHLAAQPWVMSNREMAEGITEMRSGLAALPAEMTRELGFNPVSDVHAVGLCGRLATSPTGEPAPSFLVVVQGTFDATVGPNLARQMRLPPVTLSNGATAYGERDSGGLFALGSPAPGVLLFGSEDLLAERLLAPAMPQAWQTAPADSLVGRVVALAPGGPRTIAAFAPSVGTRFLVGGEAPVSLGQLMANLRQVLVLSNGRSTFIEALATGPDGHRDFELILSGLGAYMEAAPHVMRAFAHVVLGVLSPDDPELEEPLRAMLRSREDLLSFFDGLGAFTPATVTYTSDPATRTTTLLIDSPHGLTSVGFLMGMGAAVFMTTSRSYEEPYYYDATPIAPPAYPYPPAGP